MYLSSPHRHLAAFGAVLLALFFVASLITPTVAVADDSQEHAEQLFIEGRGYFEDGDYLQAAENFREAYEILGAPELLYNIGQAYRRADAIVEAEEYFQKYLNEMADAPNEDEVVETIHELQQERAARKATVDITTDPEGADVYLGDDSDQHCQAPCSLDVDPGSYALRAELDDHDPASRDVEIEASEDVEFSLSLDASVRLGEIIVTTDVDNATLIADGEQYALPRSSPVELEAGSQTIAIEAGGDPIEYDIEVDDSDQLHLFIPVDATGQGFSPFRAGAIGLGGASAAFATAAIITGLQTRSTHQAVEQQQETFGEANQNLVSTGISQQRLTNGLLLGSILTLGTGVGLWTWDMMQSKDDSDRLEPTSTDDDSDDSEPDVDML